MALLLYVVAMGRLCTYPKCPKYPSFGYASDKKPQCCKKHKTDDMVNVIGRRCREDDCPKHPVFGHLTEGKMVCCFDHKEAGMINLKLKNRICKFEDCPITATYGHIGERPSYCSEHHLAGMQNVINRRCKICDILIRPKFDGYCYRCFIHTFPDNQVVRNHKTKERTVADFMRTAFSDFDIAFDRRVQNGCSLRRPDILMDFGDHVIIVEIDENQHEKYDCSCENKRLMQLFTDVGSRPTTMIRFNPDEYNDVNNKSITSCWKYNKKGLCVIKETKKKEWQKRLATLQTHVQYYIDNGNFKEINVVHLFYDGWSL